LRGSTNNRGEGLLEGKKRPGKQEKREKNKHEESTFKKRAAKGQAVSQGQPTTDTAAGRTKKKVLLVRQGEEKRKRNLPRPPTLGS